MFTRLAALATVLAAVGTAHAAIGPLAPDGSVVYKTGGTCRIAWSPDTSGKWNPMNIQLMSGDNLDMRHVTTVGSVDGTTTNSFEYPCPAVTPNSAIYFYQFSSPNEMGNLTWTTRFAISDADGNTTPPANPKQPDGGAIPWGVGTLVDQSAVKPPPSYLPPDQSGVGPSDSASGSASGSASATGSVSASGSGSASASASVSATGSASSGMVTKAVVTSSRAPAASASGTAANASAGTDSTSGALGAHALSLSAVALGALVGAVGLAL